jgi:ABC-type dipeptide/oligopeptide/nickel transport system permease subunit
MAAWVTDLNSAWGDYTHKLGKNREYIFEQFVTVMYSLAGILLFVVSLITMELSLWNGVIAMDVLGGKKFICFSPC